MEERLGRQDSCLQRFNAICLRRFCSKRNDLHKTIAKLANLRKYGAYRDVLYIACCNIHDMSLPLIEDVASKAMC